MLTCFKVYLKEAAEKKYTILQGCSAKRGILFLNMHFCSCN